MFRIVKIERRRLKIDVQLIYCLGLIMPGDLTNGGIYGKRASSIFLIANTTPTQPIRAIGGAAGVQIIRGRICRWSVSG